MKFVAVKTPDNGTNVSKSALLFDSYDETVDYALTTKYNVRIYREYRPWSMRLLGWLIGS